MKDKIGYWNEFWKTYRHTDVNNEADLYFQVGKTVNKEPVKPEVLQEMIERICENLNLSNDDNLMEVCCGNGIVTSILANHVNSIVASDFSDHLIVAAKKFKAKDNVRYFTKSAMEPMNEFVQDGTKFNKFLMNDSLAYFESEDLKQILNNISDISEEFTFLITGISCDELKWNFYNTEERVARYKENIAKGEIHNDGLGRWWKKDEFMQIAKDMNLIVKIEDQPHSLSNYRIDVLFQKKE